MFLGVIAKRKTLYVEPSARLFPELDPPYANPFSFRRSYRSLLLPFDSGRIYYTTPEQKETALASKEVEQAKHVK